MEEKIITDVNSLHQVRISSECMRQFAGDYFSVPLFRYYSKHVSKNAWTIEEFDLFELLECLLVNAF